MSKLSNIFEGWKNHLAPNDFLKEQITRVSMERMEICKQCPLASMNKKDYYSFRPDDHCTECGCSLVPKSKCLSCKCPKDYWGPVVTPEEEQIIDDETDV